MLRILRFMVKKNSNICKLVNITRLQVSGTIGSFTIQKNGVIKIRKSK